MADIKAVITEAGLKRSLKAALEGKSDVGLAYIVLGEGKYQPDKTAEDLKDRKLKIDSFEIEFHGSSNAVITCRTDEPVDVAVSEIGIFFEDDTLFALWANNEPMFFKGKYDRVRYRFYVALGDTELVIPSGGVDFDPEQEDEDYSLILAQLNMGIAQIKNARINTNK